MNIPKNGRIAIIDDKIEQVYPLMELFSKHQFPYLYYDGKAKGLPEKGRAQNDIRILFLDIYLTGDALKTEKEIKSTIIPVLDRIISAQNYPYLLIFWSRHEQEHSDLIKKIFLNELKDKAPISFLSLRKSDYFKLDGGKTTLHEKKIPLLFSRIKKAMNKFSIYSHIMTWENLVHEAADKTVEQVFKIEKTKNLWDKNSKYLFYKLAHSYSGKSLANQMALEQIKSGFYSLNFIFSDSLEDSILNGFADANVEALDNSNHENHEMLYTLNKRILFSEEKSDKYSPGIIFEVHPVGQKDKHGYDDMLSTWINREIFYKTFEKDSKKEIKGSKGKVRASKLKKFRENKLKELRKSMREDWKKIEVNVTPICDHVQGKSIYCRFIPGLIINSKYFSYFNSSSEAIYLSPQFKFPEKDGYYFLLLDFRFFTSILKEGFDANMKPIFRIRQTLLSEIQSKLSRHVNRQGILFLAD